MNKGRVAGENDGGKCRLAQGGRRWRPNRKSHAVGACLSLRPKNEEPTALRFITLCTLEHYTGIAEGEKVPSAVHRLRSQNWCSAGCIGAAVVDRFLESFE